MIFSIDDELPGADERERLRNLSYPFIDEAVREIELQDADPEMPVYVRNRLFDNVVRAMAATGWSSLHGKRRLPEHDRKFWYARTAAGNLSFRWNGKKYVRRPPDAEPKPLPDGPIYYRDGRRHPSDRPALIWVHIDPPPNHTTT